VPHQSARSPQSSGYESTNRFYLLIADPPNEESGALARSRLDVTELNNMTPDMTLSGAGNGREPN
jgi:hypothetical protein